MIDEEKLIAWIKANERRYEVDMQTLVVDKENLLDKIEELAKTFLESIIEKDSLKKDFDFSVHLHHAPDGKISLADY